MNSSRPAVFWIAIIVAAAFTVYLLKAVLLPFVAGALVAYFLQPAAGFAERLRFPRGIAAAFALVLFFALLAALLALIVPPLTAQVTSFADRLPTLINVATERLSAWLPFLQEQLGANLNQIKTGLGGMAGDAAKLAVTVAGGLLAGGFAVIDAVSLLFIMPIVAFYLLRDWPDMIRAVDGWLPRPVAPTVRALAKEMDRIVAGFVRGVGMVCVVLGVYYAIGLSLAGLQYGLAVGLFAGLAAFIPVFGALIAFCLSLVLALAQFESWGSVVLVLVVFAIGQVLEGQILTPRFVGGRVGLHPVWILFALMAGGALFGFVGVLLAVPAAAAIGVLTRFALARYRDSVYFQGVHGS